MDFIVAKNKSKIKNKVKIFDGNLLDSNSFESKIKAQTDATSFYNSQGQLFKRSNSNDAWIENVRYSGNSFRDKLDHVC